MTRSSCLLLAIVVMTFPALAAVPSPAASGDLQVGGSKIHYEVFGEGPAVVLIDDGRIVVRPTLLRSAEWSAGGTFEYQDVAGRTRSIQLPPDSFAFTFCQVPVLVERWAVPEVAAHMADGTVVPGTGGILDRDVSATIFGRTGQVRSISVRLREAIVD